jgi:hypothetical protein
VEFYGSEEVAGAGAGGFLVRFVLLVCKLMYSSTFEPASGTACHQL